MKLQNYIQKSEHLYSTLGKEVENIRQWYIFCFLLTFKLKKGYFKHASHPESGKIGLSKDRAGELDRGTNNTLCVYSREATNDTLSVMLAGTQKKTQGEDELSTKGRKKRKLQNTGQTTALCVSRLWHLIKEGNEILL